VGEAGCLAVGSDYCTSSATVDARLQTGRQVAAGPVGGKCVRQKGEKI
jgi:hypothetical protein